MAKMIPGVEAVTEEARLALDCACGDCHPTATAYRDDLGYERHDRRLAEGPCCCGRFFVIGEDAEAHAQEMAADRVSEGLAPNGYDFDVHRVSLPWGGTFPAVSADLRA